MAMGGVFLKPDASTGGSMPLPVFALKNNVMPLLCQRQVQDAETGQENCCEKKDPHLDPASRQVDPGVTLQTLADIEGQSNQEFMLSIVHTHCARLKQDHGDQESIYWLQACQNLRQSVLSACVTDCFCAPQQALGTSF